MRYSALPILLVLFSITFNSTQAEVVQSSEVVVIQIQNFDSEKNMAMYALFQNDENVVIVNSCDVSQCTEWLRPKPHARSKLGIQT